MRTFLGVDGGGSKTAFVLIDEQGEVLATHDEGPAYYPEIGLDALHALLARGIAATLAAGGVAPGALAFAFLGLPAYGEDSRLLERLDAMGTPLLGRAQYRCGNDMICGWAGALGCKDGINVIAGTGSIAYGEYGGRQARAGGWGELFSDEGSAYWIAREGLNLFSRMSDGRAPRGPLYGLVRAHFSLEGDLDLCAAIYGANQSWRSKLAQLARLVAQAAAAGDARAAGVFAAAADELAAIVEATRDALGVPHDVPLPVSWSGGMFGQTDLLLEPMKRALVARGRSYAFIEPRMAPATGAALYAAHCVGIALAPAALERLGETARRAG